MFTKEAQELAKATVEAIKKISKGKWKWKPEVGQWYIYIPDNELCLLGEGEEIIWFDKVTPLLHWENDIEQILEGMGYVFEEPIRRCYGSEGFKCHCVISLNGKRVGWGWGKKRQEAVQLAVIELGKEK